MAAMARRLSSPVFVGRADELQTLVAAADAAASGQTALLLVGGEAGVGKTRLVAEVAGRLRDARLARPRGRDRRARRRWTAVRADRRGAPRARPRCRRRPDRGRGRAQPARSSLASSRARPWSPVTAAARAARSSGSRSGSSRAILRLLGRLGEVSPVLLVVEDLHWADRSTRDLLAFLARNARDERLLIARHVPHR